ncbi:TPA: hypothetical protein SMI10_002073 [Serratia liquefaciens]|nr:hypothetical protein [Serratia liquefaciens]
MSSDTYSKESLVLFLEELPSLGVVSDNTVKNLKTVPRFLEFAGQDFDNVNNIDVDEVLRNYAQHGGEVSEKSLRSYKSRIQQAIKIFVEYTNDPKGFSEKATMATEKKQAPRRKAQAANANESNTFDLPVPLRSGLTVTINNLPRDLTKNEAKFISSIIETYGMFEDLTKD